LQTEEEEDPAKEAFNGTAFAQFVFGPSGRQTRAVLLSSADSKEPRQWPAIRGVDPVDQLKAPVGGIQANDARAKVIETNGQC
jgi:hypothetical protein